MTRAMLFMAVIAIWTAAGQSSLSTGNWLGWFFIILALAAAIVWIALIRQERRTVDLTIRFAFSEHYANRQTPGYSIFIWAATLLLGFGIVQTDQMLLVGAVAFVHSLVWLMAYIEARSNLRATLELQRAVAKKSAHTNRAG